ncbi:TrbG/VirB9 family P-type conjugative transfer protein [Acidithiobacillus sp.]|uniref:TrbG/VirB9 family P-type conjugative transfer protein n=1 Tax=Acidithiobacillus sp. TaxID=1872118 RepID=UPI0025C44038|nr:TrbG/VirB9 family P-type conjugative transfer protein [Acidithiobacillus sp.]
MKHSVIAFSTLALVSSTLAFAAPENSGQLYHNLTHEVVPGTASTKTVQQAIRQASQIWHDTGTASAIAGNNGEVLYPYGQSAPTVLCSPLHTTIIKLLPGEKIAGSALGDKIRWTSTNLQLGNQAVVLVRPMQKDITTNLVIAATNGKIYDLTLVSDKGKYVPTVGFYNPQQEWNKAVVGVQMQQQAAAMVQRQSTMTLPNINPADLDFTYYVTGPHEYRPIRVFSAAGKVYLQMPANIKYHNAPAVFVMENGKEQLTNFQMIGGYYVIDQLFHEAKLLLGTGSHKQVVTIHAGSQPSFW